jgi:hypothetical protein
MDYASASISFILILVGLSMLVCLIWLISSTLSRIYPTYSVKLGYPICFGLLGFILGLTNPDFPTVPPVFKGLALLLACTVVGFYAGKTVKKEG